MKQANFLIIAMVLFFSCVNTQDPPVIEEEIAEDPPKTNRRDFCEFDLSDVEGEFDLFRKWEFVGFQEIASKKFDQLTCMARVADFALSGEDFDNVFQIILEIKEVDGPEDGGQKTGFHIRTFSFEYAGLLDIDTEGITFLLDTAATKSHPGPAFNTLPMLEFEGRFLKNLESAKVYHLDNNKLYFFTGSESHRMVFLALGD